MDRTRRNALSITTTTRKTDLSVRVSRFLNLLDCTTDDDDDDDGDEDDRVSQRPYHRSAAINTQQWTGTNKLRAFPDVDARSVATVYPPTVSPVLLTELIARGRRRTSLRQNRSNLCRSNCSARYNDKLCIRSVLLLRTSFRTSMLFLTFHLSHSRLLHFIFEF